MVIPSESFKELLTCGAYVCDGRWTVELWVDVLQSGWRTRRQACVWRVVCRSPSYADVTTVERVDGYVAVSYNNNNDNNTFISISPRGRPKTRWREVVQKRLPSTQFE